MRKTYAVLILAFIVGISMSFMLSCNTKSDSPTAPSYQGPTASTSAPPSGSDATAPQPAAPATPAPSVNIKVKDNGTVVNNTQTTYTACVFDAPYGEGVLADQWKAKPGRTDMEYVNPGCEEKKGQVDVIDKAVCPQEPHGLVPLAANPGVTIPAQFAADSPQCAECEEEEPKMVGKPVRVEGSEGDWSDCGPREEDLLASTDAPQCHKSRTFLERTTWQLCDEVWTTDKTRTEYERCECPCVEEWIPEKEPEVTIGKWGECEAVEEPEVLALEEALMNTVFASTNTPEPEKCYGERSRIDTWVWYETNSCSQERRVAKKEQKKVTEPCEMECPYAEGYCFYNISGRIKEATCRAKLGGSPLRFGEWGRWPDGPPSDHCRFTVPGIYSDLFRQFQLTPGQSDPRCNSR